MLNTRKVSTCLWFNGDAEDAARFYVSLIEGSRFGATTYYGPNMPMPEGSVMTVDFDLGGTPYMGLNGGPQFPHTEAASIMVACRDQAEIDRLWSALTADGGKEVACGWLNDKYGLRWQIVPARLSEMFANSDQATLNRVMTAVVSMVKLDIATLEAAHAGK